MFIPQVSPNQARLPHSTELERTVLALLLDGRHAAAMHEIRQQVKHPLFFFHRDHRLIYQACLDVDESGHRVEVQSVADVLSMTKFEIALERLRQQQLLQDGGQLDGMSDYQRMAMYRRRDRDNAERLEDSALAAIGGYAGISDLLSAYGLIANLKHHVEQLVDYYLKRQLIARLEQIGTHSYRTTDSFASIIDHCNQVMIDLTRGVQNTSVYDASTVIDEMLLDIQERVDSKDTGVLTGYEEIDDLLIALRPGGLYILAARPGVGKTSFALSLVQHVCAEAEQPVNALFFSLEVDRADLLKKLVCARANIPLKS